MHSRIRLAFLLAVSLGCFGCASDHPPSRLNQYLGESVSDSSSIPLPQERPVRASLVVISDRSASDGALGLPDEARARLVDQLREEINRGSPIWIEKVIEVPDVVLGSGVAELREFGKQRGLRYLVVAILSNEEQEYPVTLFLGWTTHQQPGFRRDNWSLVETALLDIESGQVVLRAEGRAWATLDRPTAPGINQWYPVIYLRPQNPERRIWPPTYEGAPISLRIVAMTHAVKRLALNMQDAWIEKRQSELALAQP
jgi:hypothetical protein